MLTGPSVREDVLVPKLEGLADGRGVCAGDEVLEVLIEQSGIIDFTVVTEFVKLVVGREDENCLQMDQSG